jgi:hypothetical protein
MRDAPAGNPEERCRSCSSHAEAEIRWEPVRSKANRKRVAGHSGDRPPDPETLRKDPPRLRHILIQGILVLRVVVGRSVALI